MLSASQQNTTPHHHESHQEQDVFDIVKAGKGKVCTIIVMKHFRCTVKRNSVMLRYQTHSLRSRYHCRAQDSGRLPGTTGRKRLVGGRDRMPNCVSTSRHAVENQVRQESLAHCYHANR